ncbi:MAG: DUF87 domain-containing protein [Ignavibacteria bacterium]|jgi:DNA helicase HerA-like ATPase|nr:DUF87 domain-containing protein [Ignavibacteria bacterium]
MNTDFDNFRSLSIGTVNSVSSNEIRILLDVDAPQNTSINTGTPRSFPKINSYLMIPNEVGGIVGMVNWIGVEHSPYPKRKGYKDFDLIDLPFPLRKLCLVPIGTLKFTGKKGFEKYTLERGIYSFPSVGDIVVLPTDEQLNSIVENRDENAAIIIGKAPIANNAEVRINPDKLFGRHFAVLGNTGSGKSCSVAGLIRWSIQAAKNSCKSNNDSINARFIVLDPNGEYCNCFNELGKPVRLFKVVNVSSSDGESATQLKVPAWMWNSDEWITFSQASPGVQRPLLLDTLRFIKSGVQYSPQPLARLVKLLTARKLNFELWSSNPNMSYGEVQECGKKIGTLDYDLRHLYIPNKKQVFDEEVIKKLNLLAEKCKEVHDRTYSNNNNTIRYSDFREVELLSILTRIKNVLEVLPSFEDNSNLVSPDTPRYFDVLDLPDFLDNYASTETSGRDLSQFVNSLNLRIKYLMRDERAKSVIVDELKIDFAEWLEMIIGGNSADNGYISIIDLSLVPADIIHILISVISRVVFEAVQRYKRKVGAELPTVLVLEEAHTFIRENRFNETTYSQLCRETFERIAREGRKFGLSLLLSSQRPSELSSTVLSQCNTFLLHRIVNDRDQDLIRRLVPDNIGALLNELPILPTRKAILLGWATPIPILVEMRELSKQDRPMSNDAQFWKVWINEEDRKINWKDIADEWQGYNGSDSNESTENNTMSNLIDDSKDIPSNPFPKSLS